MPPGGKRYILGSALDRDRIAGGPLGPITEFRVASDGGPALTDAFPIAGVAASDEGEQDLRGICDQLGKLRSLPPIPVLRIADPAGREAALIAQLVAGPLARLARFASSANAQLLDVRREREQLFEQFRALEDAFNAQAMSTVACVFEQQPYADPCDSSLGPLLADGGIAQLLPVTSTGFVGFALHLRSAGNSTAALRIRLELVETEEPVGEWLAAPDRVAAGWNYFALARALSGSAYSLRIRLMTDEAGAPEPSLGFFLPQLGFESTAAQPHPDLEHRPLAFRLYTGIPGVRPDGVLNMLTPTAPAADSSFLIFRMPRPLLESVELCTEPPPGVDYPLVTYIVAEACIHCHPTLFGPTGALLRGAVPTGTQWVQASAKIAHDQGRPAFAGMLVVDPHRSLADQIASLPAGEKTPLPHFSGWAPLRAGEAGITLHVSLPDCPGQARDLVLLSTAGAEQVDFAWVRFCNIRLARHVELGGAACSTAR